MQDFLHCVLGRCIALRGHLVLRLCVAYQVDGIVCRPARAHWACAVYIECLLVSALCLEP